MKINLWWTSFVNLKKTANIIGIANVNPIGLIVMIKPINNPRRIKWPFLKVVTNMIIETAILIKLKKNDSDKIVLLNDV